MPVELNIAPYYDDFDETKNYYRVLARPGEALQAREITTLQTILQNQIDKFGKHIFKNGSIVLGGQISYDTRRLFLSLTDSSSIQNGEQIEIYDSMGDTVVGEAFVILNTIVSGIPTLVITEIYGNLLQLTGNNIIKIKNQSATVATVASIDFVGAASTASVSSGIFFVDGVFVFTPDQTILLGKSVFQTKKVGLNAIYEFIDENGDPSLLDNAAGFNNHASPGSHRLKISLALEQREVSSSTNEENFIELLRLVDGVVTKQVVYPIYSELEKTLARRTHDESGHYTVRPFLLEAINSFKGTGSITITSSGIVTGLNTQFLSELDMGSEIVVGNNTYTTISEAASNTLITVAPNTNPVTVSSSFEIRNGKKLTVKLGSGKAYIKGFEFETISPTSIVIDKARVKEDLLNHDFAMSYGGFVVAEELNAVFDFYNLQEVDLLDYDDNVVGSAKILNIVKLGNDYRVYLFDIEMSSGSFSVVRKITENGNPDVFVDIKMSGTSPRGYREFVGSGSITIVSGTMSGTSTRFLTEVEPGSRIVVNNEQIDIVSISSDTSAVVLKSDGNATTDVFVSTPFSVRSTVVFGTNTQTLVFPVGYSNISQKMQDNVTDTFSVNDYFIKRRLITTSESEDEIFFYLTGVYRFSPVTTTQNYQLFKVSSGIVEEVDISGASIVVNPEQTSISISEVGLFELTPTQYILLAQVNIENITPRQKVFNEFSGNIANNTVLSNGRFFVPTINWASENYTIDLEKADITKIRHVFVDPRPIPNTNINVSTDTFTLNSHGYSDDDPLLYFSKSPAEGLSSGRTYYVTNSTANTFQLSETVGGSSVDITSVSAATVHVVSEADISNLFVLDDGQRDLYYQHAKITSKISANNTLVSQYNNKNILILFDAWIHNSSNGFIAASSYDLYPKIPTYTSRTTGITYNLRDCVDFRPIFADSGGLSTVEPPQPDTIFESDLAYFLGRFDRLTLTPSERTFKVFTGVSAVSPKHTSLSEDVMNLYNIELNPYTYNEKDLTLRYIENKRYTMRDIGRIEKRVENLEYYTSLSLLEKKTMDLLIRDGEGNERFKNGFLVDRFSGHNVGDVTREDYKCSIDFERGELRPRFSSRNFKLHQVNPENNNRNPNVTQKTGSITTIPYGTVSVINQNMASGFSNVNPYSVFTWSGILTIEPRSDFWTETERRPDLIVNVEGLNDNILSENFEGTRWNDWEVNWTGIDTQTGDTTTLNDTTLDRSVDNDSELFRDSTITSIIPSTTEVNLGTRVVDVSVVPFIRSNNILMEAERMKPNTKIYGFFDGVDVTQFIVPESGFGSVNNLMTDPTGSFRGTFSIPSSLETDFRFRTGDKILKLTDSSINNPVASNTFSEAIYSANGVISTVEDTIARITNFIVVLEQEQEQTPIATDPIFRPPLWIDPVAQSFLVDFNIYPEGIFVSKVKLFFRNKDQNIPVTVQIRPTQNGYPHSSFVMPFATKTLPAGSVNVPNDVNNINDIRSSGTEFVFDSPVYLQPGEYAIIVLANTNDYEVYTAEIGETLLGTNQLISEQPYAGSFFKSQNASTWTAEQTMDLMFEIFACEFETNQTFYAEYVDWKTGVIKPYSDNTIINLMKIGNTIQSFPSCSLIDEYVIKQEDSAYVGTVGNYTQTQSNRNIPFRRNKEITQVSTENFRYSVGMRTNNKFVSPIIDDERVNLITIENIVNNDSDNETGQIGGNAEARYITRVVNLADVCDYLKCILTLHKPSGTDIKVYYKVLPDDSSLTIDDVDFVEMTRDNAEQTIVSVGERDYIEVSYSPNSQFPTSIGNFTKFLVKIVMLSNNKCVIPKVKDLRVIALDII